MIIDFHTHVFPPYIVENRQRYIQSDACFAELYSSPKARLATADELVNRMDRDGVDVSVILNGGWATQELCVEINDYILESIVRYPKRLIGFCTTPLGTSLQSMAVAVSEIERCVKGGIRGVGELRPGSTFPCGPEPEVLKPIMDVIRENNLVLLVHASEPVGHLYPGKGSATPDNLYSLVTSFPDIKLVCAHWGGGLPFYALMPEVKAAMNNVYFDTAASPFLYTPEVYRQVIELVGAERVLFGSDYPLLTQRRLLREIESAELTPDARGMVLSGNACRLLGITAE
jgi:predicted TIM-barrel fold metal-dependent hydrolase